MRILYIHQYFKTPEEPGGTRSYWISKKLIEKGHRVTVLTTSSNIDQHIVRKKIDGIDVVYVRVPYDQRMGIFKRLTSFLRFMMSSTRLAWGERTIDLIISTSTPLTVGFPALVLKWFRKVPFVFEVRDLWPEVPIQMGALDNRLVRHLARWFEKTIYRNASHVVTLSPGMQEGVVKYIPIEKTSMIPNMAKIEEFWPREIDYALVDKLGLNQNSFKVIHFGALGLANGADYIIDAAELLQDVDDIEFVFIGGGSTENQLKDRVQQSGIKNVKFLGTFPMRETSEIVNFCDVSIVSFSDIPILSTNSPNKLFDSLSAGKPILVNSRGWTKDLVEKEECGFFVDPQFPIQLVEKILFLKENSSTRILMAKRSRSLAETRYDKDILCQKFTEVVNECGA